MEYKKQEINEIDQINEEAWFFRSTDSNRALVLSQEAVRRAEAAQYERGIAEGLRTLGFSHIRLANYPEAIVLLTRANEMFKQTGDLLNQTILHEYFGILYRNQGDYVAAFDEFLKSLAMSREGHFRQEESSALYHLGITYKYVGDLDKALECCLQGLPIARAIDSKLTESYHLNCLGGIYYEMSWYDEARDYYQQSLALRQEVGDLWGVAGCYDNIVTNIIF